MSIDLEDMAADVSTATVFWKKDSMEVKYRPSVITLERIERFEKGGAVEGEEDVSEFLSFLEEMLVSWDLLVKGVPIQTTAANLKKLPFPFLRAVLTTVLEDVQSGEAEKPLGVGSAPGAMTGNVQAGTQSTVPQNGTESDLGSFSTVP